MKRTALHFLFLALIFMTAVSLFMVKNEVVKTEADIKRSYEDIKRVQSETHVLKAEWAYLTNPKRVEALTKKHLNMVPMVASQIVRISTLPSKKDKARKIYVSMEKRAGEY